MKIAVFLIIFLFSYKVNAQITISGQIKNAPDSTEVLIKYWNNSIENIDIVVGNSILNDGGYFSFSSDLNEKRFAQFIVNDIYLDIFLCPGDTINIYSEFNDYLNTLQFESKYKNEIDYLVKEKALFRYKVNPIKKYKNTFSYKSHIDSIEKQHIAFYTKYVAGFKDSYFSYIIKQDIKYTYIYNRSFYGIDDFKNEIPLTYYSFLDSIDLNLNNLITTQSYYQSLNAYLNVKCYRNISNISNYDKMKIKQKEEVLLSVYHYIKNKFSGEVKDYLLSEFIKYDLYEVKSDTVFMNNLIENYFLSCNNTTYKNHIKDFYNKRKNITNTIIPNFEFIDIYGEKLNIHSLKGKYIYIDFWATWCYPCLLTIKDYPALQEKYKNRKDIVYLFINIMDEKDKWSSFTLSNPKYGINWFADKTTTKKLTELFEINGIPRYVLIDKNLRIIDPDADFPKKVEIAN